MCNDLATLTMFVPCLVPFLIMLLTPKLIGVLDTIRKRRLDWAEARSFALEVPFSLLLAPLLIYLHTTFVLGILRGQVTPWISPSRNPGETLPLRTAVRMFWLPGILALGLTALAWWLVPSFLVYLLTIIVGWMLAIPLATWNSMPQKSPPIWSERIRVMESNFLRHFELGAENRTPSFRSPSRCRNQWSTLRTAPSMTPLKT